MRLKKGAAIAAVIAVGALLLPLTSVGSSVPAAAAEPAGDDSLVERIIEASESGATDVVDLSVAVGLPASGPASLDGSGDALAVTVLFQAQPSQAQLDAVAASATIERRYSVAPALAVSAAAGALDALRAVDGVVSVEPALRPTVGSSASAELAAAPSAAPSAVADTCRDVPVDADEALLSDVAKARFGVDGTGITVGIISDSFGAQTAPTSPDEDVALGVLPGPGNPCGYTEPVEVLSDAAGATDEGRAMAQLVHGIAPGATLKFATSHGGLYSMAQAVADLTSSGADIIVDDISYADETLFQQGVLSSTILEARELGVAYYTSAGNETALGAAGSPSAGLPVNGWMTPAYRPTACPAWMEVAEENTIVPGDCLDWDPSGGGDPTESIGITGGHNLTMLLNWGEPTDGIESDFDLQFYLVEGDERTLLASSFGLGGGTPIGLTTSQLPLIEGGYEIELVIMRDAESVGTPAIAVSTFDGAQTVKWREHDRSIGDDVVGITTSGHSSDGSAVSVAASVYEDPLTLRSYSSVGALPLLFEPYLPWDTEPAAAYDVPQPGVGPVITGVDGTRTSFFGRPDSESPWYNFFGTSAAAPNVAAVHALAAAYAPGVSANDITAVATATAREMPNPLAEFFPTDQVVGAGAIDASALLAALPTPAVTSLDVVESTAANLSASWAPSAPASSFRADLLSGDQIVDSQTLASGSTAAEFAGLTPGAAYRVRVTTFNSQDAPGASATSSEIVMAAVQPSPGPSDPGSTPVTAAPLPPADASSASGPLARTGVELPIGGGIMAAALVLLGGAAFVMQARGRRRAAEATE